jgi:iron complex transport system permease protein
MRLEALPFGCLAALVAQNGQALPIPIASLLIYTTYFLLRSNWLNAVAIGDDTARSVGIKVVCSRLVLFIMCSLLTGVLIAISGVIGFVGLLIPHFARLIVGADNRKVLMFLPL